MLIKMAVYDDCLVGELAALAGKKVFLVGPGGCCSTRHVVRFELKLSVGSGIEVMLSNPVRPIEIVHFGNPIDRLAESPTGSPSLSK